MAETKRTLKGGCMHRPTNVNHFSFGSEKRCRMTGNKFQGLFSSENAAGELC